MTTNSSPNRVEELIDWSCNLIASALVQAAEEDGKALNYLQALEQYISYRYSGELMLALQRLINLGEDIKFLEVKFWNSLIEASNTIGSNEARETVKRCERLKDSLGIEG